MWSTSRISTTLIPKFISCPKSFDLSMSGATPQMEEVIQQGAQFGIRGEKIWDKVFKENWFKFDKYQKQILFDTYCDRIVQPEDKEKMSKGFNKCLDILGEVLSEDYKVELQKKYVVPIGNFENVAKLDYLVHNPEPIIIDAKGSSKAEKHGQVEFQLTHYSWLYWSLTSVVPRAIAFYYRLGTVHEFEITEDVLIEHGRGIMTLFADIERVYDKQYFKEVYGSHCFMCGFKSGCKTYSENDSKTVAQKIMLKEAHLYG